MIALALALALQTDAADDHPKNAYVMVQCVAGQFEIPQDCRAVESSHPDHGLEEAALTVMRRGRIGERQGMRVGQAYRIRVNFQIQDGSEGADTAPSANEGQPAARTAPETSDTSETAPK